MKGTTLFYFCYDHQRPTGGQKRTYRHVDILNKSGYEAYVLHSRPDFRLTWFEHSTAVVDGRTFARMYDAETDYLVLPEDLGQRIGAWPGRKVILNKNLYRGFHSFGAHEVARYPYHDAHVVAAFTISEHNRRHLQFTYPHLPIFKLETGIDAEFFKYRPLTDKKRQVVCSCKRPAETLTLYHMLRSRAAAGLNRSAEYEWVFLNERPQSTISQLFQESPLFIFLSIEEGFARMPLEAMMCGCLVVGHQIGVTAELPPFAFNAPLDESLSTVVFIERVLAEWHHATTAWEHVAETARSLAVKFQGDREEASVRQAWGQVLLLAHQRSISPSLAEGSAAVR